MKINIITLGCSKNVVDSEHVAGHLRKAGFQLFFDREKNDCEVVIVNTCGFIGDAKEESVNTLLEQAEKKKRSRTIKKLVAIGCLVERYRNELASELPEIDAWYGVHQWNEFITSLTNEFQGELESERLLSTPKHYAYLKISEGCNRHCSYCAIPQIRGPHVSRPLEELLSEAKTLVANGVKELIVIAQDTTCYGLDIYGERKLGTLLKLLATQSGARWIRLHYTYPSSFPQDAIEAIRTFDNICNYIDIPLQHINSQILTSMQRGVDKESTLRLLHQFREQIPDVAIRTTLIVGYPGETDAEFEELKEFVQQIKFERLGVFTYSPEEDTPAFLLGDPVPDDVKQRRLDELMSLQEQIALSLNQKMIGNKYEVLIDRKENDFWIGRTRFDSPEVDNEVLIPVTSKTTLSIGQFVNVVIDKVYEHDLIGHVAI